MSDDESARLRLPYLAAAQMQKHVTLNEALTRLDALVQAAAVSRSVAVQPEAPDEGALHLLPEGATGADWSARAAGDLVRHEAGGWQAVAAPDGMVLAVLDEGGLLLRHDGGWTALGARLGQVQGLSRLGLNTTADAANPLAARLNKALWTALEAGAGGDGALRFTFNKETSADVLSLLFQSGWSGRAELGLVGDDDLSLKVSADGSAWIEALRVDRATGRVAFPRGALRSETTVLTEDAGWTPPAWASRVEALCIGGGAGGGGGFSGAAGAPRYGGGGGAGGGLSHAAWDAAVLTGGLVAAVGAGGSGGASGVDGADGGDSTLRLGGQVILTGAGGRGGGAGDAGSGAGGAAVPGGNGGGASSLTQAAGPGAQSGQPQAPGGGGAGGGLDASDAARTGGAGGAGGLMTARVDGGASGASGASAVSPGHAGGGGGGGSASAGSAGQAGGAGGDFGAGGGGGGAGLSAGGAGGGGASGLIVLTAIG